MCDARYPRYHQRLVIEKCHVIFLLSNLLLLLQPTDLRARKPSSCKSTHRTTSCTTTWIRPVLPLLLMLLVVAKSSPHKVAQAFQCPCPRSSESSRVYSHWNTRALLGSRARAGQNEWSPLQIQPHVLGWPAKHFWLGPECLKLSFRLLLAPAFIPCLESFKSLDKLPYMFLIFFCLTLYVVPFAVLYLALLWAPGNGPWCAMLWVFFLLGSWLDLTTGSYQQKIHPEGGVRMKHLFSAPSLLGHHSSSMACSPSRLQLHGSALPAFDGEFQGLFFP